MHSSDLWNSLTQDSVLALLSLKEDWPDLWISNSSQVTSHDYYTQPLSFRDSHLECQVHGSSKRIGVCCCIECFLRNLVDHSEMHEAGQNGTLA